MCCPHDISRQYDIIILTGASCYFCQLIRMASVIRTFSKGSVVSVNDDNNDLQSIRLDIDGVRPSYELSESDDPSGFDEELTVMIRVRTASQVPGSPKFSIIDIKGSRAMQSTSLQRIDGESSPGIGLVTSTKDGLIIQTMMPFDAAWQIAGAIKAGQLGTAFAEFDPTLALGERAFLRGLRFTPS